MVTSLRTIRPNFIISRIWGRRLYSKILCRIYESHFVSITQWNDYRLVIIFYGRMI